MQEHFLRDLGAFMALLEDAPVQQQYPLRVLYMRLWPAMQHQHYELMWQDGHPVAYVNWAWLTAETSVTYRDTQCLLTEADWVAGDQLWFMELIAKNGSLLAKDGFEALRQYDLNHDNLIDANDAVFANLKIWVDANKDGVSQSEELHGLADIGVHALKLNAEVSHTLDNGNVLSQVAAWVDNRGQEHAFVDVTFATSWQSQANHAVM